MSMTRGVRPGATVGQRSDGTPVARPLSPHLQVYDMLQMTSTLSIGHRLTGVLWTAGMALFAWWLIAAAEGAEAFATVRALAGSVPGVLLLLGFTAALWFHTLAGIRHLAWDAGYGFDMPTVYRTGWGVIGGTGVLTLITWIILLASVF